MVEEDMQLVQDAATIGDGARSVWVSGESRDGKENQRILGPPCTGPS